MLVSIFTGCETGKNNFDNKVGLDGNKTKVYQENQSNESKNNEFKQKGENTECNKNNQAKKIDNEIDLSEIDLSGEDEVSGIMVGGFFTDSKNWKFAYKKFNGIGTIRKFKCNEDGEIEFEYSNETAEGNINVIILDEDYIILKKFGANESKTFKLEVTKDQIYSIRIIGDNAKDGQTLIKVFNTNLNIESID